MKGRLVLKSFYTKLFSIITISGLGIIVYSNTFHSSFHFDDEIFIINNFVIRNIQNLQESLEVLSYPIHHLSINCPELSFPSA